MTKTQNWNLNTMHIPYHKKTYAGINSNHHAYVQSHRYKSKGIKILHMILQLTIVSLLSQKNLYGRKPMLCDVYACEINMNSYAS